MQSEERNDRGNLPDLMRQFVRELRRLVPEGETVTRCQLHDLKALAVRANKIERRITRLARAFVLLDGVTASQ